MFSVLICGVFFLPGARNDAIQRPDGSFNWIYVDTQYFHSMAASIKSSDGPPRDPGTATEELLYHFGPYAPAAAISRLDGLNLGDAFARVTRGASLWALVLSCFGLGTLLSLKATAAKFGGIASVAGLFFYGSLSSLFTDERVSSSHVTGAILFTIPNVAVTADGGPFSHLILGHSVLHGLIAITAVMGLGVVQRELGADLTWRRFLLLAMPALAVPMHSVAALYCFGVVCILLFWGHLKRIQSWLLIMLSACLFLGAWKIMGSGHSADATLTTINTDLGKYWWTVAVWFVAGLGFRIIGFRWISKPWKDPFAVLVFASVIGLLSFALLLQFPREEERYGMYFLQSIFSIFAFSRLTSGFWRSAARARWAVEWLGLTSKGVLFLIAYAVLMGIANRITRSHAWISYTRTEYISILLLGLVAVGTFALAKHSLRFAMVGSAILMGVLSIGFLAWVTPWLNYGQGRMKMDVTLSPGEVQGLRQLHDLASPEDHFATNKHAIDIMTTDQERSYGYAALAERPVLLEGYAYHSEASQSGFKKLLSDNDLMFSSTDPETVRSLTRSWGVRWLVARPGTDIALSRPLPGWLVEQQNCGELRIYRVDQPSSPH